MSMVSVKTIEVAGIRRPELSKCKEVFEKYAKFYKSEDVVDILEAIATNVDVTKLFLELVDCQLDGRFYAGIIGKTLTFSAVPAFEIQHKIVTIYNLMLNRVTDEKDYFIEETLKKATENGVIMLVIRVLDDIKATDSLLDYVNIYEEKHSKDEVIDEARFDKVFRKRSCVTDGIVREVIENSIAGNPNPDVECFFRDSVGREYEPRCMQKVLREAELNEYINEEREMEIVEDLACEDPAWDRFYEKELDAATILRMATGEYNWDDGTVIPYVLVKQKNCNKDTAKAIFEFADGDSYLAIEDPRTWEIQWIEFFKALKYQIEND